MLHFHTGQASMSPATIRLDSLNINDCKAQLDDESAVELYPPQIGNDSTIPLIDPQFQLACNAIIRFQSVENCQDIDLRIVVWTDCQSNQAPYIFLRYAHFFLSLQLRHTFVTTFIIHTLSSLLVSDPPSIQAVPADSLSPLLTARFP